MTIAEDIHSAETPSNDPRAKMTTLRAEAQNIVVENGCGNECFSDRLTLTKAFQHKTADVLITLKVRPILDFRTLTFFDDNHRFLRCPPAGGASVDFSKLTAPISSAICHNYRCSNDQFTTSNSLLNIERLTGRTHRHSTDERRADWYAPPQRTCSIGDVRCIQQALRR